jgi:hypothetical protein
VSIVVPICWFVHRANEFVVALKTIAYVEMLVYGCVAHSFVNVRFVMIVLFAFVINIVVALFLIQRRSSGMVSRNVLKLLEEASDDDVIPSTLP